MADFRQALRFFYSLPGSLLSELTSREQKRLLHFTPLLTERASDAVKNSARGPCFSEERRKLEEDLGVEIRVGNIVEQMLEDREKWGKIRRYIQKVLKKKQIKLNGGKNSDGRTDGVPTGGAGRSAARH